MNSGRGLQRKGVREKTHAEAPAENIDSGRTSTTAARQRNPGDSMIGKGGKGEQGALEFMGKWSRQCCLSELLAFFYVIFQVIVIYRHKCVR